MITGSGFHDGPWTVLRSRWAISSPQMIHAIGSYVGADGSSRLMNPSTRLPAMIATARDTGRPVPRAMMRPRGWSSTDAGLRPPETMDVASPGPRDPLLVGALASPPINKHTRDV